VNRTEILETAAKIISKDRADQYGDASENFARIARYWTMYLDTQITRYDVAMMMTLLKIARAQANVEHTDNYIDACGYQALAAELSNGR